MKIAEILKESCIVPAIKGKTKEEIIAELVNALQEARMIDDAAKIVSMVMERERLGSTGIGSGVAIPHGKLKGINTILCAFGISKDGVDFDAADGNPVQIFFLMIAPEEAPGLHLQVLSRITKILRDQTFCKKVITLSNTHDIYTTILEEDDKI